MHRLVCSSSEGRCYRWLLRNSGNFCSISSLYSRRSSNEPPWPNFSAKFQYSHRPDSGTFWIFRSTQSPSHARTCTALAIRHAIAACGYLQKSKLEFWGKIGEKIFYSNFKCAVMSLRLNLSANGGSSQEFEQRDSRSAFRASDSECFWMRASESEVRRTDGRNLRPIIQHSTSCHFILGHFGELRFWAQKRRTATRLQIDCENPFWRPSSALLIFRLLHYRSAFANVCFAPGRLPMLLAKKLPNGCGRLPNSCERAENGHERLWTAMDVCKCLGTALNGQERPRTAAESVSSPTAKI